MITNTQIKNFLNDWKTNAETIILEKAKEKNELLEIAKKRGIIAKNSPDLGIIKSIYAFADKANENGAILPEDEVVKALPTIIGKPMNKNHWREEIRGVYIDYKYFPKEKKIVTYSTFFKNIYPEDWEEAQKLFKQKRLAMSFEIWSDKKKKKYITPTTYELHDIVLAGGGLLFDSKNHPIPPAFPEAKALAIAKKMKECVGDRCLVLASKQYNKEDLIVADMPAVLETIKITCSNCGKVFDVSVNSLEHIKCPECKAILDRNGIMIYPPQNFNFNISCPNENCKSGNIVLEKDEGDRAIIKCLSCNKRYELTFHKKRDNLFKTSLVEALEILPTKSFSCPQCGNSVTFKNVKEILEDCATFKCPSCDLKFTKTFKNIDKRLISSIVEIDNKEIINKNDKGGNDKMEHLQEVEMSAELVSLYKEDLETSAKLTYQQKKNIPDNLFAVVVKVKNKKTGKMRKIRMFPIQDEAHVRNALARLGQDKVKATLAKLGVSVDKVENKILKRAKELKMTDLLKKHQTKASKEDIEKYVSKKFVEAEKDLLKSGIKKLASNVVELKKKITEKDVEIASVKKDLENKDKELNEAKKKIDFYKENAVKIVERKTELGEFAKDLSDEDLLDDIKFENASLKKDLASRNDKDVDIDTGNKKDIRSPAERLMDEITFNG